MAAGSVRNLGNLRSFMSGNTTTRRTLVVLRTGIRSSVPCVAIVSRPFSDTTSPDEGIVSEKFPTISRSPLFSGNKVAPKTFQLSFDEFQKQRRKLRTIQRLAGLPFGITALFASSFASAYMFPNMFDATPEQIQPILLAGLPFGITALFASSFASAYMFPNMFDATPEQIQPILGMDPMIFCGLCGVASAGVGFVAGIAVFKSVWRVWNKEIAQNLQEREADFLERITSRRASSYSKFEDDYYGENIKNVGDYRQWLREQQKKQKIAEKYDSKEESKEVNTEAA